MASSEFAASDARISLPRSIGSSRQSREFVRAWLRDAGNPDDYRPDVSIVVAELVNNAVTHGARPIELHLWHRGDGIRVGVSDGNQSLPELRNPTPESDSGRGLRIVDGFAEQWGTELTEGGKLVWADLPQSTRPRNAESNGVPPSMVSG